MDRNTKIARLRKILPVGRNTRKYLRSKYVMNTIVPMSNAELTEQMKYYKGQTNAYWNEIDEVINTSNNDMTNAYVNNGYYANSNNNHNGGKRRKTHRRKFHKRRTHKRRN